MDKAGRTAVTEKGGRNNGKGKKDRQDRKRSKDTCIV